MKLVLQLILTFLLVNCTISNQKNTDQKMESEIALNYLVFEFHDASVPPPYHRSYALEFKDDYVRIVVDSYGEILTDTIVTIGEDKVAKSFDLVKKHQIVNQTKTEEKEGCTGGTGISINYGVDDQNTCSGYVYFCAGDKFGDLSGDLESLKYGLKELIPNFNQYLKED